MLVDVGINKQSLFKLHDHVVTGFRRQCDCLTREGKGVATDTVRRRRLLGWGTVVEREGSSPGINDRYQVLELHELHVAVDGQYVRAHHSLRRGILE